MIQTNINGVELTFITSPALFSPNKIDPGTLALISEAGLTGGAEEKVLDLGCGYGVVGVYAAKLVGAENVVMLDSDAEAVRIAAENAALNGVSGIKTVLSDGFEDLDDAGFTLILTNPPYHTNFGVAKRFIEKGFNRLIIGGRLMMVTKRLDWYKNKLASVFGGVRVRELGGYYVFTAERRGASYSNKRN